MAVNGQAPEEDLDPQDIPLVSRPCCRHLFFFIRLIGSLLMTMSVLLDFVYFFKQSFSARAFFYPYAFIVWTRFALLWITIPALIYT
jgi:hypothetical protein